MGSTAENECYYRRRARWVAHFSYDFLIKITINNQQINPRKSNIRCSSIIVRNGIFTCLAKRLSLHVTKKKQTVTMKSSLKVFSPVVYFAFIMPLNHLWIWISSFTFIIHLSKIYQSNVFCSEGLD